MKVAFVNYGWKGLVSLKGARFNRRWPPLCLLNCAAILEKEGAIAEILDGRASALTDTEINKRCGSADMIFVTSSPLDRWQCPNLEIEDFLNFVRSFKGGNVYVMGAHGTVYPQKVLSESPARAVIRGEGELAVLEIFRGADLSQIKGVSYLKDGSVVNNPDRPPTDIKLLPMPAYHLIDIRDYEYELLGDRFALLETSRGCPFSCVYCFQGMYGDGRYRQKTVDQVINEVDHAVNAIGARSLYFIDLEFTLKKDFVRMLCDAMIKKGYPVKWCCQTRADTVDAELLLKMRKAGCRLIHYGVETGSEKIMETIVKNTSLDDIEKGVRLTREAGIETACFFMFGFPQETVEDTELTIQFALKLNPSYASFHIATPYPGTRLYAMSGTQDAFPEFFGKGHNIEDLNKAVRGAMRRFYMRPQYMLSHVIQGGPARWKKQFRLFKEFIK